MTGSLVCVAAAALLLAGCSAFDDITILGYTTGSQFPRDIRTVRVPIFLNKTFVRGIEFELTEAVIKEIERRTPWKVVDGEADAELTGVIVNVAKQMVLQNPLNEVREAELTMSVEIAWRDLRVLPPDGQIPPIADGEIAPGSVVEVAPSPAGTPPGSLPPGATLPPSASPGGEEAIVPRPPVSGLPPVLVQRSVSFVPELGESYATARKQLIDDLAAQIVSMLEIPW